LASPGADSQINLTSSWGRFYLSVRTENKNFVLGSLHTCGMCDVRAGSPGRELRGTSEAVETLYLTGKFENPGRFLSVIRRDLLLKGIGSVIERYTRPEMGAIWSDEAKVEHWLAVELAVCEAWGRRGDIPPDDLKAIRTGSINLARMKEIEKETDHDVIAFLRAVGETVGPASRFIHLGLTSSDVVDTGLGIQAKQAGQLIRRELDRLTVIVGHRAVEHKRTITIGRSHGMHAEPTTFGMKLAVWYDELRRHQTRLDLAIADIAVGKISGAVGTHAHVPWGLEDEVCAELGLGVELASTQVVQRDRHAFFLSVLAGIGATLEKIGIEIRHLQRSEVGEAEEFFGEGNQGSSAMPHKRNPHESERVSGLARLLRGYATPGLENVALWHERDISHSSVERVIFPDACIVLDYMLDLTAELIENWVIYPERMLENLNASGGLIFSQRVLLALVESGMDRQEAYKLVQSNAHAALANGEKFQERVSNRPEFTALLSQPAIDKLFDPWEQLHAVDATFERLGLGDVTP
jgi:adenylosuccinate lyase